MASCFCGEEFSMTMKTTPCFWCGKQLFKKQVTKDHLMSRPMRSFLKLHNRPAGWVVSCCKECNGQRCCISVAFSQQAEGKVIKQKAKKLLPLLKLYKKLIAEKLTGEKATTCLLEIDMLKVETNEESMEIALS